MAWWKSEHQPKNREAHTTEAEGKSADMDKNLKTGMQKGDSQVYPVKPNKGDNARKSDRASQVKVLVAALKDKNGSVRAHAAWALGQMGDAKVIEYLVPLLTDKDTEVRRDVSDALKRLGYKPRK